VPFLSAERGPRADAAGPQVAPDIVVIPVVRSWVPIRAQPCWNSSRYCSVVARCTPAES